MPTPITVRVFRGDALVRTEQFNRDIIKIGRLASAHLVLDDEKISRIHAVIELSPDGNISIIDMGSAEGTFVNGKKVSRGVVKFGDQVTVGGMRLVLEAPAGAPAEASAPAAAAPAAAPAPAARPAAPAPAARMTGATRAVAAPAAPAASAPAPAAPAASAPAPVAARAKTNGAAARAPAVQPSVSTPASAPPPEAAPAPAAARPRATRTQAAVVPFAIEDLGGESDIGVELRLLWGQTLLDAGTFVRPAAPILVGETDRCVLKLEGLPLPELPVLRFEGGDYRFTFVKGMNGVVQLPDGPHTFGQLVREKKATADNKLEGGFSVAVPKAGVVRAEVGKLAIEARARVPRQVKGAPFWERINYQFLNLFLILFFLQAGFIVAANNWPYDTDVVADDLFKNPQRMAKFIIKAPEPVPQPKAAPKQEEKKDDGEAAAKAKGDEGQMGKKDAPKTNARSAPKAIDPNAKDVVKRTGLLAALGRGAGGLSTVMGTGGLGGDLKGAVGNMFGPTVGDSYGLGGLGIRGSGTGGGGTGETIGIGAVGTKGRGGGLGNYGTGVGGLGTKSDRPVNVSAGTPTVMGSIDRELIRKVIQEHAAQIRYCYEQQLAINPRLQGKVAVKWVINADGSATNPQIDGTATTLEDGKIHECMMSRITSWQFPKPKGGGIAVITYPWILRSAGTIE